MAPPECRDERNRHEAALNLITLSVERDKLHNAFVLGRFACRHGVGEVRLAQHSEEWPDGFVRIADKTHEVEVTSTDAEKLGDKYREVKGWMMDPVENWVARGDSIPRHLDEAVSKKIKKRHSDPCWLVIYLNINEWGIRQKETEAAIAEVKQRYASSFEAIFVLWNGRLLTPQLFPHAGRLERRLVGRDAADNFPGGRAKKPVGFVQSVAVAGTSPATLRLSNMAGVPAEDQSWEM